MKPYLELAVGFARTGVTGYGGGPSTIPLIEFEAVKKYKWMTEEEFGETLALANTLPGPIATKMAAYIGYKVKGKDGCHCSYPDAYPSFDNCNACIAWRFILLPPIPDCKWNGAGSDTCHRFYAGRNGVSFLPEGRTRLRAAKKPSVGRSFTCICSVFGMASRYINCNSPELSILYCPPERRGK